MDEPRRYQRSRAKGWRMPPNSVYVGRPTPYGNPYVPHEAHATRQPASLPNCRGESAPYCDGLTQEESVQRFRRWWLRRTDLAEADREKLRGKNLVCWCRLVDSSGNKVPCHADVLLEWANE